MARMNAAILAAKILAVSDEELLEETESLYRRT